MTIKINGLDINYTIKGEGDFVFLLHGWGANLKLFEPLADVIAEKYTVVSLDFPGFGLSEEPHEIWDVSDYSRFFVEFVKHFGCKKAIVLGHSFGGRIIIKTASFPDLPFSFEKIILTDSAGILPKRSLGFKVRVMVYKLGKAFLSFKPIKKMFPNALNNYRKKMGSSDYNNASETMRSILVKVVNEDLTELLKNIKCSTLLVWGENDTATPVSDGQLMEKSIKDSGLVVLKNAGHFAFLDQAYSFHKIVKSFLEIGG